jgi:hypothetical protein
MGHGGAAVLPRLDGVNTAFEVGGEDRRAVLLARTLTELNIADPADWQHNASRYVTETLDRWIRERVGDVVRRQFSLHATLRNNPAPYSNEDHDPERFYLAVEADAAAYLVMGPTLEMLEQAHRQLPVTFYHLLTSSIRRCLSVYDYREALDRIETWKEWIEGEGDSEEYELPDVEACIPATMRETPLGTNELRDLISDLKDDEGRGLVQSALDLDSSSRRVNRRTISEESREALADCNTPLPALLVCFKPYDAVEAVFDEERQIWLEAEPEPAFLTEVDPSDTASVRQTFAALADLCQTLAAAGRLMARLPGNHQEES